MRRPSWLIVLGAALLLAPALGAAEQQPQEPPPAEATAEAEDQIEDILEGDEDVFLDTGYTYDPGDRRDPFKSLLAATGVAAPRGERPEGVPGLLIDEISLTGIFHTGHGYIAQVVAADKEKSYLVKVGDQLYDGDVVSITKNEVVFKKIVNDPTRLKPFMEVVKKLNPT